MNLQQLLGESTLELKQIGLETPDLDVRVILKSVINKNDAFLYSHPEYVLTSRELGIFKKLLKRRKSGEPVAYLIGNKEFFGYDFIVNKNVLVPRPESEWLVDAGISFLQNNLSGIMNNGKNHVNILDMGTGSGCIAVSLYKNIHNSKFMIHDSVVKIYGVDFNSRAVAIAKKNARELNAQDITFLNSNLFNHRQIKNKIFNLIIANLPYVPHQTKDNSKTLRDGIDFEPQDAIFADDNGAAIIKKFIEETKKHTEKGSLVLIELDPRNAIELLDFSSLHFPTAKINLEKDLSSLNRYLTIQC